MHVLERIYQELLLEYGLQGWWPLLDCKGTNPTKTGSIQGYHPGDYSYPKTADQQFEICVGAILTQNTSWVQVEKVLLNLKKLGFLKPWSMRDGDVELLKNAIRPAGYFNQKARKIKEFTQFFMALNGRIPSRNELLTVWGVGPETADSILLYAYRTPTFVVDTYTRRILTNLHLIEKDVSYDTIKLLFETQLPRSVELYQEYHALLVEHAKRLRRKT